jgi:hypothetical protein
MTLNLPYVHALLLEEIAKGRAEILLNNTPALYYVNDRQADESIMPFIESLYEDGLLNVEKPFEDVYYYTINNAGNEVLAQSIAVAIRPC